MYTRGSEAPVRRWCWIANLANIYLIACLVDEAAAIECYCNVPEGCVNNRCTLNGGQCRVELKQANGGYHLEYFCSGALLGCISEDPHDCCSYPDCNRCLLPQPRPEGVDIVSLLPPECPRENITIQTPPPAPPTTDSNNNRTDFLRTTPPGGVYELNKSSTDGPYLHVPGMRLNLPSWLYAIIFLSVILIFLCIFFLLLICWFCYRRRHHCEVDSIGSVSISEMESFPEEVTQSNDSGGLRVCRFLEPRTIGQQVVFKERLAKGGFGEVWRGDLNGEPVAVKVISSLLEDCWKKEQDIYLTNMLHHESILRFIAVDSKLIDYSQKLIIIVEYHPNGSLYDYLSSHVISSAELLKMLSSIINGIAFLHMPVTTSFVEREKPAIAHRDIKTKNILVKQDGSCCIADFGLAVRSDEFKGDLKPPDPIKGTKRYMAPEILSRTINGGDFQSFIKVDIYSFGLVLWETTRRCGDVSVVGEYQVAYQNCVPNDPSIEDMRKVVVTQGLRPDIDERWKSCELTSTVSSIMQECWRANPQSRLSAFRIKKKLQALSSDVKEILPPKSDDRF